MQMAASRWSDTMDLRNCYAFTRIVFLRYLAFIYAVAFLVAYTQNEGLIGSDGLTPAKPWMDMVYTRSCGSDRWRCFTSIPTLFWYMVELPGDVKDPDAAAASAAAAAAAAPFYAVPVVSLDVALEAVALAGLALSVLVLVLGAANVPIMALLWVLYTSIVNVGQVWYGFGWESQLLETGFLAIWLCPWLRLLPRVQPPSQPSPPSRTVVAWGYRWLLFRIMIGAGLIKIRGDQCWRDLTCMDYHYQTQPVPNPLSPYFHAMPPWWHRVETMGNHVVELLLPWLLLLGRDARLWGGCFQVLFQGILICSGNLSFLNWLTVAPAIWCFDDAALLPLFSAHAKAVVFREAEDQVRPAAAAEAASKGGTNQMDDDGKGATAAGPQSLRRRNGSSGSISSSSGGGSGGGGGGSVAAPTKGTSPSSSSSSSSSLYSWGSVEAALRLAFAAALFGLLATGSAPVVANLLSSRQAMNTSFDAFKIVNTYGAFGSITKERTEVVLQGTHSEFLAGSAIVEWRDYEFKCKPGALGRRPCVISPFHYRLDWLMWFAAFQDYQQANWIVHLTARLLTGRGDGTGGGSEGEGEGDEEKEVAKAEEKAKKARRYDVVRGLIAKDPFIDAGEKPPRFIRAQHFRYRYSTSGDDWWTREEIGNYLSPLNLENPSMRAFLQSKGWSL